MVFVSFLLAKRLQVAPSNAASTTASAVTVTTTTAAQFGYVSSQTVTTHIQSRSNVGSAFSAGIENVGSPFTFVPQWPVDNKIVDSGIRGQLESKAKALETALLMLQF